MKYKILVTGSEGQLGKCIKSASENYKFEVFYADKNKLDITNLENCKKIVNELQPDFIVNCAAYTAVDKAEDEGKEQAYLVNETGAKNLAQCANGIGATLVHISTDYVFDGVQSLPYTETYRTNPLSVYGDSKLAGEKAMFERTEKAIVLRTSWLYSVHGTNFLKTILKLSRERGELKIVNDQIGSPTKAGDLAEAIFDIILQINEHSYGIYHYSNEAEISWYEFAKKIIEIAGSKTKVSPIASAEYFQKAKRPSYSVLDKSKIKNSFDISIKHWEESLKEVIGSQ